MSRLSCLYSVSCNHHNHYYQDQYEAMEYYLHQESPCLFQVITFLFLVVRKNKRMGNSLSKLNDKPFTLLTPPVSSGHLKKAISGVQKNPVKYFATGVHRNYG